MFFYHCKFLCQKESLLSYFSEYFVLMRKSSKRLTINIPAEFNNALNELSTKKNKKPLHTLKYIISVDLSPLRT